MTECRSPELQDLLPDYVAEALDSAAAARVAQHLAECEHCAEDLVVLQMVRRARPRVAVPDIARIVAALPPATGARDERGTAANGLRVVRAEQSAAPARAGADTTKRATSGAWGLSVWRLAAVLGVVIAGGASVLVARRGVISVQGTGEGPVTVAESVTMVATAPVRQESLAVLSPDKDAAHTVSVSYGDLGDYSEAELERMIERLDKWDGATSTEPLPGVPILPNSGGDTP